MQVIPLDGLEFTLTPIERAHFKFTLVIGRENTAALADARSLYEKICHTSFVRFQYNDLEYQGSVEAPSISYDSELRPMLLGFISHAAPLNPGAYFSELPLLLFQLQQYLNVQASDPETVEMRTKLNAFIAAHLTLERPGGDILW